MSEKIKVVKAEPNNIGTPLVIRWDKDKQVLLELIGNSFVEDTWKVEVDEMSVSEYEDLGEHKGW